MLLTLESLSLDELEHLFAVHATSVEGVRLHERVACEVFLRKYPWTKGQRGRWDLLTWFARQERIMSLDEMRAALDRVQETR